MGVNLKINKTVIKSIWNDFTYSIHNHSNTRKRF
jgi:hypothetical protein